MPSRTLRRPLTELSLRDLAEMLGQSAKTIRARLFESPAVPMAAGSDGIVRFPSRAALQRVLGTHSMLPATARARRDAAQARLAELEYKRRSGELVHRSEPARAMVSLASMVSARLQGIPSASARELAAESKPAVCEAVVRREIYQALNDLADAADRAEAEL